MLAKQPFDEISRLFQYWKKFPPAHVLLRSMAGYQPREESVPRMTPSTQIQQPTMMDPALMRGVGARIPFSRLPEDVARAFQMAKEGKALGQEGLQ